LSIQETISMHTMQPSGISFYVCSLK
jgi:hypothetical protein